MTPRRRDERRHQADEVATCVSDYGFRKIKIDFVYLTIGSAAGTYWRNLANSILAARAAFPSKDPLLIVRADQLYDWRLLRKVRHVRFQPGIDAFALIDTESTTLSW